MFRLRTTPVGTCHPNLLHSDPKWCSSTRAESEKEKREDSVIIDLS